MNYYQLSNTIKSHIISISKASINHGLQCKNIQHALDVAERSMEISAYYDIHGEELFVIFVGALFHDIAYFLDHSDDHEIRAVEYMHNYCATLNIPERTRIRIEEAIMATKRIKRPTSRIEQIICDADTYHFGTPLFRIEAPLVNGELRLRKGYSATNWPGDLIRTLEQHYFYTEYCQDKLSRGKAENIKWLSSLIQNH